MKVAILGGAGFIGSHIIDALWDSDIREITVVDNLSAGRLDNMKHPVHFADRDIAGLGDFFKGKNFDWVINLAAQVSTFESVTSPEKDFRTNAEGIFYLLEALRKSNFAGNFIYTSSRSIYGDITNPVWKVNEDNTPYKPSSIYNTNKYYGELLTRLYGDLYNLKYWIIRPSNVYGPRQPGVGLYNFVCRWIAYAIQDKKIAIWGSGEQIRDFVFVEDIADAYLRLIQREPRQDTFLLASGKEHTLYYLADLILSELNKSSCEDTIEFKPPKAVDIQRFVGD